MLHPRKPLLDALSKNRKGFLDCMQQRITSHENHARVTSSELAYKASSRMAATLRAAKTHLEADDVDAVCADLSAWIMATECSEQALRDVRFGETTA